MYLAGRTDLDAASAEIDARRLPFAAMRVADSHGQRDPRAGCAPPVRGAARRGDLAGEDLRLQGLEDALQVLEGDRLGDDLDRTEPQARLGLELARDAGHNDHGDAGVPNPRALEEVEPVHTGEPEVEQDQVGAVLIEAVERALRGEYQLRFMAELGEKNLQDAGYRPIGVPEQDPH